MLMLCSHAMIAAGVSDCPACRRWTSNQPIRRPFANDPDPDARHRCQ
jgi:hypothetical protein